MKKKINRYFVKKPIARIRAESESGHLKRTLGPWNLVSLGIGCIIGAGIFVMTGTAAAQHAGPAIMLSFILAGFACAFAGLCYAELASVLPISGSAYTYTYATLGELFAWVMGWLLVLEYGLASATVAVGWSGYVVSFLKDLGIMIPPELSTAYGTRVPMPDGSEIMAVFNLPAAMGIAAVSLLLTIGISESAKVNNFIVMVKMAVIVAFILVGAFYVNPDNWHPFIPENTGKPGEYGYSGIVRAAGIIFFAYIGFEAVSTAAQEAKNPQKDMPIGILGSLVVCTVLYILVAAVLTGIVPYPSLNVPDPIAVAVDRIGLGWFAFIIKIGAIMGLSSVMLVLVYGQTRIFYVMGRDGLLPSVFCKVHDKFKTPHLNTLIVGSIVALAAGLTPIKVLGDMVSLGTLTAFAMVSFSVLYLRKKEPKLHRPFRTPGMPWVPILGILSSAYLVSEMPEETFSRLKYWLFAGLVIYIFFGQFNSVLAKEGRVALRSTPMPAASGLMVDEALHPEGQGGKRKKRSSGGKKKATRRSAKPRSRKKKR